MVPAATPAIPVPAAAILDAAKENTITKQYTVECQLVKMFAPDNTKIHVFCCIRLTLAAL